MDAPAQQQQVPAPTQTPPTTTTPNPTPAKPTEQKSPSIAPLTEKEVLSSDPENKLGLQDALARKNLTDGHDYSKIGNITPESSQEEVDKVLSNAIESHVAMLVKLGVEENQAKELAQKNQRILLQDLAFKNKAIDTPSLIENIQTTSIASACSFMVSQKHNTRLAKQTAQAVNYANARSILTRLSNSDNSFSNAVTSNSSYQNNQATTTTATNNVNNNNNNTTTTTAAPQKQYSPFSSLQFNTQTPEVVTVNSTMTTKRKQPETPNVSNPGPQKTTVLPPKVEVSFLGDI